MNSVGKKKRWTSAFLVKPVGEFHSQNSIPVSSVDRICLASFNASHFRLAKVLPSAVEIRHGSPDFARNSDKPPAQDIIKGKTPVEELSPSTSIAAPRRQQSSSIAASSPRPTIFDVLRGVNADLVALQNVKADEADGMRPLADLARALGMHYAFTDSWAPQFGNGVLSRWPIKSFHVHKLGEDDSTRSVLRVVVDVPCKKQHGGELHFCCTQLDHLDEDYRLKQATLLASILRSYPHILAGDLNALDASDYSSARWTDIAKLRANNGKLPPRHDVMSFLKEQQGYRDCKSCAGEGESVVILPLGQELQGTCKSGTRMDYILASPLLPYRFVRGSYTIVSSRGTSDHHLVRVEIERQPAQNAHASPIQANV